MLGRVPVFRGIAATHVSAGKAQAQVDPSIASLYALFANVLVGFRNLNLICVLALHLRLRKAFLPMLVESEILPLHAVKR
jgi:hypothetical protein